MPRVDRSDGGGKGMRTWEVEWPRGNYEVCRVRARTKSEARAQLKKFFGLPIPPGTKVYLVPDGIEQVEG